jgi:glyoxylase I family protein
MIKGIEHFGIVARDVPGLAKWYAEKLGFKIVVTTPSGATFIRAQNGVDIELYKARTEGGGGEYYTPGMRHIAILVDDIAAEKQKLAAKGIAFEGDITVNPGFKIIRFADAEGNLLHLIEREKPL